MAAVRKLPPKACERASFVGLVIVRRPTRYVQNCFVGVLDGEITHDHPRLDSSIELDAPSDGHE
jgi:hypothetical protein